MIWKRLIDDETERQRYLGIGREILSHTDAHPVVDGSTDALCGLALASAYYEREASIEPRLAAAVSRLADSQRGSPALFGGATHVAWTVAHLTEGPDADSVCDAIQGWLLKGLVHGGSHYDLISGVAGFGVLAVECRDSDLGVKLGRRVFETLQSTAQTCGAGVGWFTPVERLPAWQQTVAPDGYWNLGLSHGVAGVVACLSRLIRYEMVPMDDARKLLEGAMAFLLGAEVPTGNGRFPGWYAPGRSLNSHEDLEPGVPVDLLSKRAAWCYGDLGVAVAMYAAGEAVGRDSWTEQAVALARSVACWSFSETGVIDSGICHGAAGVAHLFNRLYQATGDTVLADAARAWLRRTIAMRRQDDIAGFPALDLQAGDVRWRADASMLTGAPGVALVLYAACEESDPAWDRILLVDL